MNSVSDSELDNLSATERERENVLAEAMAAVEAAKAAHTGSDTTWRAVEKAKGVVERRQIELQLAQRARQQKELEIAEARRVALRAEYLELQQRADLTRAREALDELARHAAKSAIELQLSLARARRIAEEQSALVHRIKTLAPEIGEVGIAPQLDAQEASIVFGQRLAHHARAQNVVLEPITFAEPEVLDRETRLDEVAVPVHRDVVTAARVNKQSWRGAEDFFRVHSSKKEI